MKIVSLYARVSSAKQAQEKTIESQIAELECRISEDDHELLDEYKFIDNGYSGSSLDRPSLDRLRDKVKEGKIDKIYIHSPDRLSRNYVYQMILLEEFQKAGVEIIFLNYKVENNPESRLFLGMQGLVSEFESTKIMERTRRGKRHRAKEGYASVLNVVPIGFRRIDHVDRNKIRIEINEEEAKVVRNLFEWIGQERVSIREVIYRLKKMSINTRKGKENWCSFTIRQILRNPAYKGKAAYGKVKMCPKKPAIRPMKNLAKLRNYSRVDTDKNSWIYIPVPKIVDEELFSRANERLDKNAEQTKEKRKKEINLLQGLLVCQCCGYAYCGDYKKGVNSYYKCSASVTSRISYREKCNNKFVYAERLEIAVWKRVKNMLNRSERLINKCEQRLSESKEIALDKDLEKQESRLKAEFRD